MSGKRKNIAVSRLRLDQNNPRHHPTLSQKEAIDVMLRLDQSSIITISKHILENGLNPSVTAIVYKNERNQFIVKDGNRRVTALKCILNPDIIGDEHKNLRNKFKKMIVDIDTSVFSKIECIVFVDEAEADKWVENNHQGPQDGKGQDPWDAIEKLRYKQNKGKIIPELNVFDYIETHLECSDSEPDISIDVLKRVVTTKDFKEWTGIQHTLEGMSVSISPSEFDAILKKIVLDSKEKVIDTRKLRNVSDRTRYVTGLKESLPPTHAVNPTVILPRCATQDAYEQKIDSDTSVVSSEESTSEKTSINVPEGSKSGGPSKILMFETLNWENLNKNNLNHQSLIEVVNELRDISLKGRYKTFPIATAFLIRSAYEQCMKLILQGSGMKLNDSNQLSSLERQCIGLVKRLHKAGIVSTDLEKSLDLIDKEYTRDFLNFNVHGPGIIKATPLQLEALASKGMRSFIQLTINELESICAANSKNNA